MWARSTFTGEVTFEYSTDAEFNSVIATVSAKEDNTNVPVKVEIENLTPGTQYYYRVTDAAGDSAIGEFKTSAEVGNYQGFRFGATGDWQQAPPYPSLKNADDRDLELFVKLGDTIYADLETPALPGVSQARTLDDFRTKQGEVLTTQHPMRPLLVLPTYRYLPMMLNLLTIPKLTKTHYKLIKNTIPSKINSTKKQEILVPQGKENYIAIITTVAMRR